MMSYSCVTIRIVGVVQEGHSHTAFENRSPGTECEDRFRGALASFDEVVRSGGLEP